MATVTQIEITSLEYEAGPLQADKWGSHEGACLVTLRTADGAAGHAIARSDAGTSPLTLAEFLTRRLAPIVLGTQVDGDGHRRTWNAMVRLFQAQHASVFAVSAMDVALWDLRGVIAERPVAALLGSEPRESVQAYSSIPRIQEPERAAQAAIEVIEQGFAGVKLHSRWGDADYDHELAIAERVRDSLPGRALMYDASRLMTRPDAQKMGLGLGELGYTWLEEPFAPFDSASFAWLRDRIQIPLASFETAPGGHLTADWAVRYGGFDLLQVDCFWKTGLSGALEAISSARDAGHGLCVHHGGSGSMNLANLHLASVVPELGMVELLTPASDYSQAHIYPDVVPGLGVPVPRAPGLGGELDWDLIRRHTVGTFSLRA